MIKLCKNEDCLHIYPSFRPFFHFFQCSLEFWKENIENF